MSVITIPNQTDTQRLRELEQAITNGETPEPATVAEAAHIASLTEVPKAARLMIEQMTLAMNMIAAEMESAGNMLIDRAAELRRDNDRVATDITGTLTKAAQFQDLTNSTVAAYRTVRPR